MSNEDQWDSNRMKRIEQKLDAVMDAMRVSIMQVWFISRSGSNFISGFLLYNSLQTKLCQPVCKDL